MNLSLSMLPTQFISVDFDPFAEEGTLLTALTAPATEFQNEMWASVYTTTLIGE